MRRGVHVGSANPIDAPFAPAYAATNGGVALREFGFAGLLPHRTLPPAAAGEAVSAWLPGDNPLAYAHGLTLWQRAGVAFRFLLPERHHAPSLEAHALFTGKHLGMPLHFLGRVQAHRDRLLEPERWREPRAWLREPVLNRLPLAVWMMGPVRDVRLLESRADRSRTVLVLLRHKHPQRLSVLELSVSAELTHGGTPAIFDRFECTGTDGFLRVNGIWENHLHLPRLELHRGAVEQVQRDLPRDFAAVYEHAARAAATTSKRSADSYRLAADYLTACALLL